MEGPSPPPALHYSPLGWVTGGVFASKSALSAHDLRDHSTVLCNLKALQMLPSPVPTIDQVSNHLYTQWMGLLCHQHCILQPQNEKRRLFASKYALSAHAWRVLYGTELCNLKALRMLSSPAHTAYQVTNLLQTQWMGLLRCQHYILYSQE